VGEVGEELSAHGPGSPAGAADGDAETVDPGYESATRLRSDHAAGPPSQSTTDARFALPKHEPVSRFQFDDAVGLPSYPTADARFALPKGARAPAQSVTQTALPRVPPPGVPVRPRPVAAPEDLVRYGPGVHAAPVEPAAARVWRGGPAAPADRRVRVRQVLGSALAVILLATSGVVFYLRFHHPPLQVTRVAIVHSGPTGCTVAVAGQISTSGAAGLITYQWLFPVGSPLTRHQSVSAGQHSVNVQVTVEGSGNGTALQRVWLRVLHPGRRIASKDILVRCQ
jgi:hypothetical protein